MKTRLKFAVLASILALGSAVSVPAAAQQAQDIDSLVEQARADLAKRGLPLTPEQEAKLRLQYRQMQMFQGMVGGQQMVAPRTTPVAAVPAAPAMTTANLAALVEQLPPADPVQVQSRKDGFELNGIRVMDPEGKISRYSVNSATGDFTYLVEKSDGSRLIKRGRGTQSQPVLIARVAGKTGAWSVQAVDGQASEGETFALTPAGIVVMREDAAFEYVAGKSIRAYPLPKEWTPVPLQRGDISSTRHVLVEKSAEARPSEGSVGSLFQSFKRLSGNEVADDYALLNLDTGKVVKLAIDISGKSVTRMSDCRKQNAVVNACSKAESFESLWGTDGQPNSSHYYWRVMWMDTPQGPMAIANQRGSSEIRLFDLRSGKEVVAFRRALGIANWNVTAGPAGTFDMAAQLAFTVHKTQDIRKLLDSSADWKGRVADGNVVAGVPENAGATTSTAPTAATSAPTGSTQ